MINVSKNDPPRETFCDVCESILQYEPSDIEKHYEHGWFKLKAIKTFITCPICDHKVHLRTISY